MADPKRNGGAQPFFNDAVAATVVDAGGTSNRGALHSLSLINTTAAAAYLQIFFLPAASVTLGTTAPDHVVRLLASEHVVIPYPQGLGKLGTTGLSIAGTTTPTGSTGAAISVSASYT